MTVTVSVVEPPAPTERVGELNDSEKSLPDVIVNMKDVVCVTAPTPLTVIVLVPGVALPATLIVRVVEAEPADGTAIGLVLKVENDTPAGTEPVTDNVTGPTKLRMELPVTLTLPDPPCRIETVPGDTLRLKSGLESVSLATLLAFVSRVHAVPDESTTTS